MSRFRVEEIIFFDSDCYDSPTCRPGSRIPATPLMVISFAFSAIDIPGIMIWKAILFGREKSPCNQRPLLLWYSCDESWALVFWLIAFIKEDWIRFPLTMGKSWSSDGLALGHVDLATKVLRNTSRFHKWHVFSRVECVRIPWFDGAKSQKWVLHGLHSYQEADSFRKSLRSSWTSLTVHLLSMSRIILDSHAQSCHMLHSSSNALTRRHVALSQSLCAEISFSTRHQLRELENGWEQDMWTWTNELSKGGNARPWAFSLENCPFLRDLIRFCVHSNIVLCDLLSAQWWEIQIWCRKSHLSDLYLQAGGMLQSKMLGIA